MHRASARTDGVVDRLLGDSRRSGLAEMVRQLGEVRLQIAGVEPLQDLADVPVKPLAPGRGDVLVERLEDQSLREAESPERRRHPLDDSRSDRVVEHLGHLLDWPVRYRLEQPRVELVANHGRHGRSS